LLLILVELLESLVQEIYQRKAQFFIGLNVFQLELVQQ